MAKDLIDTTEGQAPAKPDWALTRRERAAAERVRQGLPSRRRWPWVVALLVVLAAGAGAWMWWQRVAAPEAVAAAPAAPVAMQVNGDEWTEVAPLTLRRTVKVIGPLAPERRADLSAETGGRVESVAARPGDRVEAGAVLVQVDVERLTLDVELARSNAAATRAQLALAEQQLGRAEALAERGVQAESTLAEARANAEAQRANLQAQEEQVRSAELALEGATLRAPFSGVIASRDVEPGQVVAAGTPLLTLVDLSRMEMQGAAPVSAGVAVAAGQEVELRVDGLPGRTFVGTVERIAPVAAEGTRTLPVYVAVDNAEGLLRGGMFATGEIVTAEAVDVLALPRDALREASTENEGTHVLVIEGDTLARRDVTAGEEWPGGLVRVEGVSPGDRVVVAPLTGLEPGQAVELVEF
ncbi:efflux RND transporter periplasmic adaptor subunit [Rubellimicrobium aerolatum]|uniref:Efflux RND transporter periplasmic adaptor subunit n=1 Tax=Rubellimicrobium aerolatum TaxID=490979 RepID=A0ABW0SFQ3_9RHOB|nr:efflux RND transporter periplasmic adaptor subunit [Rubellimicrobium aerolatum]MBP1807294.1 RND family efflux transporter MFP subunit [Rubellimicrobium aerolatum]